MINSKQKKSSSKTLSKAPVRIALKCSWSGLRIQSPDTFSPSSTLSDVIASVASQIPALFSDSSEDQPSVVYLRTTIWKKDWHSTSLGQILGDTVAGNILITLNLPGVMTPSLLPAGIIQGKNTDHSARLKMEHSSSTIPMDIDDYNERSMNSSSSFAATRPEPDTVETPSTDNSPPLLTPKDAIQQLLQQNFDTVSQECLFTILKIVDNILSKPQDPKVRCLRLANPTIHDKIRSKTGGLDILFSMGFTMVQTFTIDLDPKIILSPENENVDMLVYTRQLIGQVLVNTLGVSSEDIPPLQLQPSRAASSQHSTTTHSSFDPFKPFAFNVQSAAVGVSDPTMMVPDGGVIGPSLTEQRLDQLKKKQMKIEQDVFRQKNTWTLQDRNLVVYPTSSIPTGAIVTVSAKEESDTAFIGSTKGDASLIAGRLKRLEDERKKREEGGFTTSAMREVDKLMNTKVYSHTQVRIDFPDGSWLSAKFLPHETISIIKDTLRSIFVTEYIGLQFDLYITPPKRLLMDGSSLKDEGLIPAAKIRFTWTDRNNAALTSFIRPEFFWTHVQGMENTAFAYPESIPIVETNNNNTKSLPVGDEKATESKSSGEISKEDELVRRMLGKQSSILRPKGQR